MSAASWATREVCEIPSLTLPGGWESEARADGTLARGAQIENGLGRFWRIEAPGGAVSHLYGTKHSNDPLLLDLPEALEAVLSEARIVATEIDFRLPSRRLARNDRFESYRWRSARANGEPPPFEPEVRDWVRTLFSGLGFTTPYAVLTDVGVAEYLLWDPCNDFNAGVFPTMDDLIALEGVIAGAVFVGLEPQGTFLTELSRSARAGELYGILQIYGAYAQPVEDNVGRQAWAALYTQGRIGVMKAWDAIYLEGVFGPERGARFLEDAERYLLRDRNIAWLEGIEGELREGGVVMAVGAFHLPGADGLVTMLRERGFTVTRVVVEGEVLR